MTFMPPKIEPASLRQGDTLHFTRELEQFPTVDYSVAYIYRGSSSVQTIAATVDGSQFDVKADTSGWAPGTYAWQGRATALVGGEVHTFAEGDAFELLPNLATTSEAAQHARTVLASIRAVIERRATTDQARYRIGGRELERVPLPDLLKMRREYEALVAQADRAELVQSGQNSGRLIVSRFR